MGGQLDPGFLVELPRRAGPMRKLLAVGRAGLRFDLGCHGLVGLDHAAREHPHTGHKARLRAASHQQNLDPALADRFVGMYVNEWTVDYGPRGREAVRALLAAAVEAGLIPSVDVQFVG